MKEAVLILAIQCCPLDEFEAVELVRLICDIEPEERSDAEFAIIFRRDTNPVLVEKMVQLAKQKFTKVYRIKSSRSGTGWPHGPNDLWQEAMMNLALLHKQGKTKASGVLTFEPDCVPLLPNWIDLLIADWQARGDLMALGHAHSMDGIAPPQHINGNGIFATDIVIKYPQLNGCDARTGWDVAHGELMLTIGRDTKNIYQQYRVMAMELEEFKAIRKGGQIPALLHGTKKRVGIDNVRAMMKDGSFYERQP